MNVSSNGTEVEYYFPTTAYKALFSTLSSIIVLVAILGNILVIVTIRCNPNMRSTIYTLLLFLSVSDLCFAVLAPVHLHSMANYPRWFLGDIWCKIIYYELRTLYAFSVLILMLITCERFLAVHYPFSFKAKPSRNNLAIVLVLFLASLAISSPQVILSRTISVHGIDNEYCFQDWTNDLTKRIYHVVLYTLLYILPLIAMVVVYASIAIKLTKGGGRALKQESIRSRHIASRRRMSKLVFVIVIGFFVCWTPYIISDILVVFDIHPAREHVPYMPYVMIPVVLSSAINVFLYSFLSEEFRKGFRFVFGGVMQKCGCRSRSTKTESTSNKKTKNTLKPIVLPKETRV